MHQKQQKRQCGWRNEYMRERIYSKTGKIIWSQTIQNFECQTKEFVFYPRSNQESLKFLEQGNQSINQPTNTYLLLTICQSLCYGLGIQKKMKTKTPQSVHLP